MEHSTGVPVLFEQTTSPYCHQTLNKRAYIWRTYLICLSAIRLINGNLHGVIKKPKGTGPKTTNVHVGLSLNIEGIRKLIGKMRSVNCATNCCVIIGHRRQFTAMYLRECRPDDRQCRCLIVTDS